MNKKKTIFSEKNDGLMQSMGQYTMSMDSIEVYFTNIDINRMEKIKIVKSSFKSIRSHLIKIESLILNTHTSKADSMKLYYNFWENELLEFLIR